ncbi:hypothetical protein E0L36_26945 [Streptomyces sp. AJS327]|uniref:hypothetical protein n=1 Tax=Streptomyces sp. AJS327 TaxID=2545265 RepID=UPI0015E057AF|nr:hypothetical protein [Streptomyces sp. AJS327]MBA0054353.1 hypothetical protein [Streptomyces sp. AJS327]
MASNLAPRVNCAADTAGDRKPVLPVPAVVVVIVVLLVTTGLAALGTPLELTVAAVSVGCLLGTQLVRGLTEPFSGSQV